MRLQELQDNIGWMSIEDKRYPYAVFAWIQEATSQVELLCERIERLRERIEYLEEKEGK